MDTTAYPDIFRRSGGTDTVLFDMGAGLGVTNVIGVGDPDVHLIDDRWTMFLGGFTTGLAVRVFQAQLPIGHELDSDAWALTTKPGANRRAWTLFRPPRFGAWDSFGTHTPSYVRGVDPISGRTVERIYYAGRATARNGGPRSLYSIGFAQRRNGTWQRFLRPVLVGDTVRRSVFEPLVRFREDRWCMWFQCAPHEIGRGEQPDYQIRYTESADGIDNWTTPRVVFDSDDGFFDNSVRCVDGVDEMLLARGTNLYGTKPFPPQGIWWVRTVVNRQGGLGERTSWGDSLVTILDAEKSPPSWLERGAFGPDFHYGRRLHDASTMYVFVGGTSKSPRWIDRAVERIRQRRIPPAPAPFLLRVGRLSIPGARPPQTSEP